MSKEKKFELTTLRNYFNSGARRRFPFIYDDMARLMRQLSPLRNWNEEVSIQAFNGYAQSSAADNVLIAVADDQIVGTATINICRMPTKITGEAWIDDVVVDHNYRKRGIAEAILRELLRKGKECGVKEFSLTSASHRIDAHKLYKKFGFEIYDTNVFFLEV